MNDINGTESGGDLSEERLEQIRRQRFQHRVERVLEVMRRERVDWRGLPFIAADGRIGVRVLPFDCTPFDFAQGRQGRPVEVNER